MLTAQDKLNQTLISWYALLSGWSLDGSLATTADHALNLDGENAIEGADELLQSYTNQWSLGDFESLPPIVLLSNDDISGARGAYAASTDTIYLNEDWLLTATDADIIAVLTEEFGAFLDDQLNTVDTQGDEGALFSAELLGIELSDAEVATIQVEDDSVQIVVDGAPTNAEGSITSPFVQFSQYISLDNRVPRLKFLGFYGLETVSAVNAIGQVAVSWGGGFKIINKDDSVNTLTADFFQPPTYRVSYGDLLFDSSGVHVLATASRYGIFNVTSGEIYSGNGSSYADFYDGRAIDDGWFAIAVDDRDTASSPGLEIQLVNPSAQAIVEIQAERMGGDYYINNFTSNNDGSIFFSTGFFPKYSPDGSYRYGDWSYTSAWNASGELLWLDDTVNDLFEGTLDAYGGYDRKQIRGWNLNPASDGGVIAGGWQTSPYEYKNYYVRKYSPDGSISWTHADVNLYRETIYDVREEADGNVYLNSVAFGERVQLKKLNGITGELDWEYGNLNGQVWDVHVTSDGVVFVAGLAEIEGVRKGLVSSLDSSGTPIWTTYIDNSEIFSIDYQEDMLTINGTAGASGEVLGVKSPDGLNFFARLDPLSGEFLYQELQSDVVILNPANSSFSENENGDFVLGAVEATGRGKNKSNEFFVEKILEASEQGVVAYASDFDDNVTSFSDGELFFHPTFPLVIDAKLGSDQIIGSPSLDSKNWMIGGGIFAAGSEPKKRTTAVDSLTGHIGVLDVFDGRTSDFTADAYSSANSGSMLINEYTPGEDFIVLASTDYTVNQVTIESGKGKNKTLSYAFEVSKGDELIATVNSSSFTEFSSANDLTIITGDTSAANTLAPWELGLPQFDALGTVTSAPIEFFAPTV